jgi:peptidoglycan/xylan/chitin deacetylase (PgdA/CDA1 family)
MKMAFKKFLKYFGLLHLANKLTSNKLNIVLYHGFIRTHDTDLIDQPFYKKFVTEKDFENHLKLYLRYTTPISLTYLIKSSQIPKNPLIITIDDGYRNNFDIAYPLLKKYKIPATIFLTTGFIDKKTALWTDTLCYLLLTAHDLYSKLLWHDQTIELNLINQKERFRSLEKLNRILKSMPQENVINFMTELKNILKVELNFDTMPEIMRPLDWEQIIEMNGSRYVSFGSHTVSHPILSKCSEKVQQQELVESKCRIEKVLKKPCRFFAYPNGRMDDYSQKTVDILKKNHYSVALTAELGYNHKNHLNRFDLRRWGCNTDTETLAFAISGAPLFYNKAVKWKY